MKNPAFQLLDPFGLGSFYDNEAKTFHFIRSVTRHGCLEMKMIEQSHYVEEFLKSEGIVKTNTILKPRSIGPGNYKIIIFPSHASQLEVAHLHTGDSSLLIVSLTPKVTVNLHCRIKEELVKKA